jgi:hypothetical protein
MIFFLFTIILGDQGDKILLHLEYTYKMLIIEIKFLEIIKNIYK